jgi:ADP-ribosylglycohydrolase
MPIPLDHARGAMLGLALGDAWGQPLEFLRGAAVRGTPVSLEPGRFRWTDDTHMALYLAEAILASPPGAFDEEAFGAAVGAQWLRWLHDPLTPSTAPGNACLRGVRRFEASGDWRRSGDPGNDGCGAVMRIAPLALAYEGLALTRAAQIQAALTHGHPNALEAAVAASHLLRWTLEEGRFHQELVLRAVSRLRGTWNRGGVVADALLAAVDFGSHPDQDWLDEPAIPTGDGGWRSASALGLAVAAALYWGSDFTTAVDKAARIDGDSDSVACLCGMFLGAAGGVAVLPEAWLAPLPERERIAALADRLLATGRGSSSAP